MQKTGEKWQKTHK